MISEPRKTKRQQLEKQMKNTQSYWKKCNIRQQYIKCGFKQPTLNRTGHCGGCYDPDSQAMETECTTCQVNEYAI